jgi:hypothetical protein
MTVLLQGDVGRRSELHVTLPGISGAPEELS